MKTFLSICDLPQKYGKYWVGDLTEMVEWVDAETAELILLELNNGVTDEVRG